MATFPLELVNDLIEDSRVTFTETREPKSVYFPPTFEDARNTFINRATDNGARALHLSWTDAAIDRRVWQLHENPKLPLFGIWGDLDKCIAIDFPNEHEAFNWYNEIVEVDRQNYIVHYKHVTRHYVVDLETASEMFQFMQEHNLSLGYNNNGLTDRSCDE